MKRIIIFLLLSSFCSAQTWTSTNNDYMSNVGTKFVILNDTLWTLSPGAWTYRLSNYNMATGQWELKTTATMMEDKSRIDEGFGVNMGALFVYNGWIYNVGGGEYFPGSFWYHTSPRISRWKTGSPPFVSTQADMNKLANLRSHTIWVLHDTVFVPGNGYSYSSDTYAYIGKYSIANNNWTYDRLPGKMGVYNAAGDAGPNIYGNFVLKGLYYALVGRDTLGIEGNRSGLDLWKRNADYSWTKLKRFPNLRYALETDTAGGKAYMLLVGDVRNDPDYAIWEFNPDTDSLTKIELPNNHLWANGFYANKNEMFVGMGSLSTRDSNRVYRRYGDKWSNPSTKPDKSGFGQIIRKGNYIFGATYINIYKHGTAQMAPSSTYRTASYDVLELKTPRIGEVWKSNETKDITFYSSVSAQVKISLSIDNQSSFTDIATINAISGNNTYGFPVPNESSNKCYIKIETLGTPIPISTVSGKFEILKDLNIEIISVSPSALDMKTQSEPITIAWASTGLDSFNIYYGKDTINWIKAGEQVINQKALGVDTSYFNWQPKTSINGTLYLKVEERRDTALYVFPEPVIRRVGSRDLGGMICQYGSGNIIEAFTKVDVSCGWASNIGHTYYTKTLSGSWDMLGYTTASKGCSPPYENCDFVRISEIALIDTLQNDTLKVSPSSGMFYGNEGSSIIVSGRQYYIRKEGRNHFIYSDDLVNGINGIKVADISRYYIDFYSWGYGTGFLNESARLLEYAIDLSSLILNAPYYTPYDYESVNPSGFKKQIIIANTEGYLNTYGFTALPYPANGRAKKYDIWSAAITIKSYANKFRGIAPN